MARLRPYLKYKNPGCIKNISTKMVGLCNARGFIRINTFTNNHYVWNEDVLCNPQKKLKPDSKIGIGGEFYIETCGKKYNVH